MCDQLLKEEDYKQVLHQRFGRTDFKFVQADIKPISENIEGFMGDHYKLKITYELDGKTGVENIFIKTKPTKSEAHREMLTKNNVYRLEIFLYDFLFREFGKYGFDTSFAPKCYHCVEQDTLVMDDMTTKGFSLPERNKLFDLAECKSGLKSLALLHGAGCMYEEAKSNELGRAFRLDQEYPGMFQETLYTKYLLDEGSHSENWIKVGLDVLYELINYLPETEDYKLEFRKRFREQPLGKIFVEETKMKKFCGHGDLWSNNMLFKIENGVATHCCLVDYQDFRYFYPAYDVLLFLYSNTNTKLRQAHFKYLLQYYYSTLEDILRGHGYTLTELYPKEQFEESISLFELEAKVQSYADHSFVCLPKNILNNYMRAGGNSFQDVMYNNRVPLSVDAFQNDENYKKLMMSDMRELYESLFKV